MGVEARFLALGPVRVVLGEAEIAISAARERILLAMLLLHEGRTVSQDLLQEAIWGDGRPKDARNQLHRCVSRLRGWLARAGVDSGVIATEPDGYRTAVDTTSLDILEFRRLQDLARRATVQRDPGEAARCYRTALELWRGPACAGVDSDLVRRAATMLDAERLQALEECAWVELTGTERNAGELVADLDELARRHPYREQLHAALMLALYRAGRQAEALAAYRRLRDLLCEELGTEPGSEVRLLHQAILRQDLTPWEPASVYRERGSRDPSLPAPAVTGRLPGVPRELPAEVPGFVGRDNALKALDEISERGGRGPIVVTAIAGSPGVGKTALAVHWAHRSADRFPDGQLYLNLRGYSPGTPLRPIDALAALLRSLGAPPERIPTGEDDAARLYRSYAANRRILVVLDNARSAKQVRPLLPGAADCLVLVTSRDRLMGLVARDGARRITLDVLTPGEADALLTQLVGADLSRSEPAAADTLARVCGYLPLALRLAAASITDSLRSQPVSAYLAELTSDRLATLDSMSDEESSVRAAFALSYDRLAPEARRMFRILGLAPGPDIALDAAAAAGGVTIDEARDLITTLTHAHLLSEHPPGRYALHDLLRLYARDCAEREDTEQVRAEAMRRMLWWYTNAAAAATDLLYPDMPRLSTAAGAGEPSPTFREPAEALAWLDAERTSLAVAVRHATADGPRPFAWLLTSCLYGYFWHQRYATTWLMVAGEALAAAEDEQALAARAAMTWSLAGAYRAIGRSSEAAEHLEAAVSLARRSDWHDGEGYALTNLGMVHAVAGRLDQAARCLACALRVVRQVANRALEAQVLGNLGYLSKQTGRLHEAAEYCAQQLSINRQIYTTENHNTARSLSNLACVEIELGLLDAAHERLNEALVVHRRAGRRLGEVNVLIALATARAYAGDSRNALELAEAALSLATLIDDPRKVCEARQSLGRAYLCAARPEQAIACYESTLEAAHQSDDVSARITAMHGLASARCALGQFARAAEHAIEARDLAYSAGDQVSEGRAMTVLAEARVGQDRYDEAGDLAERALHNHRENGHRLGEAQALVVLGQVLSVRGAAAAARRHRRAACRLFADIGAPVPGPLP